MNNFVVNFLKGLGIGTANVIPGVSGGTIALLTGIFERLINALKTFNIKALKLLFRGRFKDFAQHTDFYFLASVGTGVFVAILTIARIFGYLFDNYPVYLWSFFFGLILASIYYVAITVEKWNWKTVIAFVIGTAIALFIAFATPAQQNNNFLYLVICGAVATCSMILPGLSGSFVLVLMGNYQLVMIDAVNDLDFSVLIPVIIGAVGGIIAFAHLLSWVFQHFRDMTIALLSGFILGSMPVIYPWKNQIVHIFNSDGTTTEAVIKAGEKIITEIPCKTIGYEYFIPENDIHLATAIVLMAIGAFIIILTEKKAAAHK